MYQNTYKNEVAIIIISHNSKWMTDELCKKIINNTKKVNFDLYVVETGSKINQISDYTSIWVSEGIRATRGLNLGINYAQQMAKCSNHEYKYFWCLMNDTQLSDNEDTLFYLYSYMKHNYNTCGAIHPSVENSPSKYLKPNEKGLIRKTSFFEIICPLLSAKVINQIFDDRFKMVWGIDFDIPYIIHKNNNMRMFIDDRVSIRHDPGTTTKKGGDEDFKTLQQQFDVSRENMIKGLTEKYGEKWARIIYTSIPEDVSKEALYDWLVMIGCNATKEDLM